MPWQNHIWIRKKDEEKNTSKSAKNICHFPRAQGRTCRYFNFQNWQKKSPLNFFHRTDGFDTFLAIFFLLLAGNILLVKIVLHYPLQHFSIRKWSPDMQKKFPWPNNGRNRKKKGKMTTDTQPFPQAGGHKKETTFNFPNNWQVVVEIWTFHVFFFDSKIGSSFLQKKRRRRACFFCCCCCSEILCSHAREEEGCQNLCGFKDKKMLFSASLFLFCSQIALFLTRMQTRRFFFLRIRSRFFSGKLEKNKERENSNEIFRLSWTLNDVFLHTLL